MIATRSHSMGVGDKDNDDYEEIPLLNSQCSTFPGTNGLGGLDRVQALELEMIEKGLSEQSDFQSSPQGGISARKKRLFTPTDVDKYMSRREMTPLQERLNAITVIVGPFYCFLYLVSGAWLDKALVSETMTTQFTDSSGCISSSWLPYLHAMPPLPLVAVAAGFILHCPFSFIYHWHYALRLPPGLARTNHWSRRMDQAMIHICSACMSYATSGRLDFFMVNLLFNLFCAARLFQHRVYPRLNQLAIFVSVVAYTIPVLRRDEMLFAALWIVFGSSSWLFSAYPIGGWSHSAFHLMMAFAPPLLMTAAMELPASQAQLKIAASCAFIGKQVLAS